jgi:hypothetical protein
MKAWKISAKNLEEPWHYDDVYVYAENRNKARSLGLKELFHLGATISKPCKYRDCGWKEDDVEYTDIIAHRCPHEDKVMYNGKLETKDRIEELEWCRLRDEEAYNLTITNPNDFAVVYAGCYGTYWGSNHVGYCSKIEDAGKYTTQEAYEIVKGSGYSRKEKVILINKEEYNQNILDQIEKLKTKLL